jgi:hypothetical protein
VFIFDLVVMDRESYFRGFSKTIQPVTQAHNWMFPCHARPCVTHHRLDLLAAVALVAMNRTVRTRRLFRAEPAAFQPHRCIIQKPLTFRAWRRRRAMSIPAMDFYHRLHYLPFPVQPSVRKSNGFGSRCDACDSVRCALFSDDFHAIIVAHQSQEHLDTSQSSDQFIVREKSTIS